MAGEGHMAGTRPSAANPRPAAVSPTVRGNPLLRIVRFSNIVLPTIATLACIIIAALHLTSESQLSEEVMKSTKQSLRAIRYPSRAEILKATSQPRGHTAEVLGNQSPEAKLRGLGLKAAASPVVHSYLAHAKAVVGGLKAKLKAKQAVASASGQVVKQQQHALGALDQAHAQLEQAAKQWPDGAQGLKGANSHLTQKANGQKSSKKVAVRPHLQKLFQLQRLALSDKISISMPRSTGGRYEEVWGNEGWQRQWVKGKVPKGRQTHQQVKLQKSAGSKTQKLTGDWAPLSTNSYRPVQYSPPNVEMKIRTRVNNRAYVPASGRSPPPEGSLPEGAPGGVNQYEIEGDDINKERYYNPHTVGAEESEYSPGNPRTWLMDTSTTQESDLGLLDRQRHRLKYRGEDGKEHWYEEQGIVNSVHKGKRLLCLKDCTNVNMTLVKRYNDSDHLPPVGSAYFPGPDHWNTMRQRDRVQAAKMAVEAEDEDEEDEEEEEPKSDLEEETARIHETLKNLVDSQKEEDEKNKDKGLEGLEKAHESALDALELAHQVTNDKVEEVFLERSIEDLKEQYEAAEEALDLAKKDDFSYLAKLVPGGQLGNLEKYYLAEDPILLNSIRRGDFVKNMDKEPEPSYDSRGEPINKQNLEKVEDETADSIHEAEKKSKQLFNALPYFPSHMMGDDKINQDKLTKVMVPTNTLDKLCLLCESLSQSGALESIPACAGMSCNTGAWVESDEDNVYDERNVDRVLKGEKPIYEEDLHKVDLDTVEPAEPALKVTNYKSAQLKAAKVLRGSQAHGHQDPAILKPKAKAASGGKTQILAQNHGSLKRQGKRLGGHGKGMSQAQVRAMACSYITETSNKEHKRELPKLFERKYGRPLRCMGSERKSKVQSLAKVKSQEPSVEEEEEEEKEEGKKEEEEEEEEEKKPEDKEEEKGDDKDDEDEEDEEEEDEDPVDEGPKSLYLYVGADSKPGFQYRMEDILSGQELDGQAVEVKTFQSISKEAMRSVLWAPDCGVVMFPPFYTFPDFHADAKKDLRAYVRQGFEKQGTVVFVGGGLEISVINYVFDFGIHSKYVAGPYYKNERNARDGTSWEELPEMVPEVGNVYGMWMPTLPPNARSFYDSFGVSVACCIRYDLGRICFLAQDFMDVLKDEMKPWARLVEAMINYE